MLERLRVARCDAASLSRRDKMGSWIPFPFLTICIWSRHACQSGALFHSFLLFISAGVCFVLCLLCLTLSFGVLLVSVKFAIEQYIYFLKKLLHRDMGHYLGWAVDGSL